MTTPPKTITVSPDATVLLPGTYPRPAGLSDTALCPCGTDRCMYEGMGVVAWQ